MFFYLFRFDLGYFLSRKERQINCFPKSPPPPPQVPPPGGVQLHPHPEALRGCQAGPQDGVGPGGRGVLPMGADGRRGQQQDAGQLVR